MNKYKTAKKVGAAGAGRKSYESRSRRKILGKVGVTGFVFAAMFAAAWAVMPVNGAEAE